MNSTQRLKPDLEAYNAALKEYHHEIQKTVYHSLIDIADKYACLANDVSPAKNTKHKCMIAESSTRKQELLEYINNVVSLGKDNEAKAFHSLYSSLAKKPSPAELDLKYDEKNMSAILPLKEVHEADSIPIDQIDSEYIRYGSCCTNKRRKKLPGVLNMRSTDNYEHSLRNMEKSNIKTCSLKKINNINSGEKSISHVVQTKCDVWLEHNTMMPRRNKASNPKMVVGKTYELRSKAKKNLCSEAKIEKKSKRVNLFSEISQRENASVLVEKKDDFSRETGDRLDLRKDIYFEEERNSKTAIKRKKSSVEEMHKMHINYLEKENSTVLDHSKVENLNDNLTGSEFKKIMSKTKKKLELRTKKTKKENLVMQLTANKSIMTRSRYKTLNSQKGKTSVDINLDLKMADKHKIMSETESERNTPVIMRGRYKALNICQNITDINYNEQTPKGKKLNIPNFIKRKGQMSKTEVAKSIHPIINEQNNNVAEGKSHAGNNYFSFIRSISKTSVVPPGQKLVVTEDCSINIVSDLETVGLKVIYFKSLENQNTRDINCKDDTAITRHSVNKFESSVSSKNKKNPSVSVALETKDTISTSFVLPSLTGHISSKPRLSVLVSPLSSKEVIHNSKSTLKTNSILGSTLANATEEQQKNLSFINFSHPTVVPNLVSSALHTTSEPLSFSSAEIPNHSNESKLRAKFSCSKIMEHSQAHTQHVGHNSFSQNSASLFEDNKKVDRPETNKILSSFLSKKLKKELSLSKKLTSCERNKNYDNRQNFNKMYNENLKNKVVKATSVTSLHSVSLQVRSLSSKCESVMSRKIKAECGEPRGPRSQNLSARNQGIVGLCAILKNKIPSTSSQNSGCKINNEFESFETEETLNEPRKKIRKIQNEDILAKQFAFKLEPEKTESNINCEILPQNTSSPLKENTILLNKRGKNNSFSCNKQKMLEQNPAMGTNYFETTYHTITNEESNEDAVAVLTNTTFSGLKKLKCKVQDESVRKEKENELEAVSMVEKYFNDTVNHVSRASAFETISSSRNYKIAKNSSLSQKSVINQSLVPSAKIKEILHMSRLREKNQRNKEMVHDESVRKKENELAVSMVEKYFIDTVNHVSRASAFETILSSRNYKIAKNSSLSQKSVINQSLVPSAKIKEILHMSRLIEKNQRHKEMVE